VAALSSEYDLFVNATYMSVVMPESAHSAYLCFFPTPFDHDLPAWRKQAVRTIGPLLAGYRDQLAMSWGTGWFPPEGGRLRQWTWTSGEAVLHLEPGPPRAIQFDLGRPGMTEPTELTVEDDDGVIATLTARQQFERHVVSLPSSRRGGRSGSGPRLSCPGRPTPAPWAWRCPGSGSPVRAAAARALPWLPGSRGCCATSRARRSSARTTR
jgi:hypothetical protein